MLEMLSKKTSLKEIEHKRGEIIAELARSAQTLDKPQPGSIAIGDLELLLRLYDAFFLDGWFKREYKGSMKFSLSGKMTKSAGKTLCPKNINQRKPEDVALEIRIGTNFFLQRGHQEGGVVCGIRTHNSLEALLLVFEHELCHVLEFLLYGRSSCSGKRFKTMAGNLFGHTDSNHKLPTRQQIASKSYGLKIGEKVTFEYKGTKLTGILYRINKKATVMVPDRKGSLTDRYGSRYARYYVPLNMLRT